RATPHKVGEHDVVCTAPCGAGHSLMRSTVRVVPQQQFIAWLGKQAGGAVAKAPAGGAPAGGASAALGKQVFAQNGCGGCHTLAAAGASGKVGPDLDNVLRDAARYAKGKPASA